jgi:hypothetical protein
MSAPVAPPRALKWALLFGLLSLTVLDRFGLRLSASYSINPATIAMYGVLAVMLLTRTAQINLTAALLYVGAVTLACLSLVVNITFDVRQQSTVSSLMLLVVLYAPFVLMLKDDTDRLALWQWLMQWFLRFSAVLAVFGIAQYFAQFVLRAPWLIDYTDLIPAAIRGSGVYNTSNAVGSAFKSNGFFLREAAGFSWYMSFALVCEWSLARRKWLLALLALGLTVSYSGSGVLVLIVALMLPLGLRTVVRLAGGALVVALIVTVFGDLLNLSYTVGRVNEFGADRSSAYCRFITPAKTVAEQIDSDAWVPLLGHGPGTTQKLASTCETTFGKVVFEYGILGAMLFAALIVSALRRSWMPLRMRAALAVNWLLLGGNLLGPEAILMIFFLAGMWPRNVADAVGPVSGLNRVAPTHEGAQRG